MASSIRACQGTIETPWVFTGFFAPKMADETRDLHEKLLEDVLPSTVKLNDTDQSPISYFMVNRYQRWYGRGIYSSVQEWKSSHIMCRMFHPCYWIVDHPLIFLYSIQWEFQDPRMEVLYHIRPYFVGIPLHRPYIGLIYGRYLQFRFLKWPLKYPIQLLTLGIVYGLNLWP